MTRLRSGDREAAGHLVTLLYPELRRMAAAKMRAEASDHSWQPSLLVNELYLQLVKLKSLPPPNNGNRSQREDFLQFAGHVMRHLLIDHARSSSRRAVTVDIGSFEFCDGRQTHTTLRELDDLLAHLAAIHPRLRTIVEMKVFEGLTVDEIADRLHLAPRTIARNWTFSKEWLREHLNLE